MKFLITSRPKKKAFDNIPPEKLKKLYKASHTFAKGTDHDCLYTFPKGGGMAIVNAESKKEARAELKQYPMYDLFKWRVRTLNDWDAAFEEIFKQFE